MAGKEAQGTGWPVDEVKEVKQLLEELPRRQGDDVMVPFGQVAFFPGQLSCTDKVFAEKHLAVAAAATVTKDGGSSRGATIAAAALEVEPRMGTGDASLVEMPTSEAAALLQQLLPQAPDPQPLAQPPRQPAATQRSVGPRQPAPVPPPAQQAASGQVQQQAQQLSDLVEGQTPEQLEALRAALQQLGARLEQQAAAAAAGQPPSTEGKEIVDIREEWTEELHGARTAPPRPAPRPANGVRQLADKDAASEGGDSDQLSEDSFEALMQRMEALEMDETALVQAAAASGAAAAADAGHAPAQKPGSRSDSSSSAGGFKRGFLLDKSLDPEPAGRQARAAPSREQPSPGAAPGPAAAAAAGDRQWQEQQEDAARRREAAFSGRVVERAGFVVAPDPASPTGVGGAAGTRGSPGFAAVEQQQQALSEQQQTQQPPLWEQQQPQQQQEPEPPQRLSRFKQRRAGLL